MAGNLTMASQNPVPKSAAIPHLNTLTQDVLVQVQVEKRLKELADSVKTGTCKQKSLRGGSVEVTVPNMIRT